MTGAPEHFVANAERALADPALARALAALPGGLVAGRAAAKASLPEFEALRTVARDIRDHTLANLDFYLEAFEARASRAGTTVHWARTVAEAREIILAICRGANARLVVKGKSMVSEEVGLNAHLAAAGIEAVETDLGEYVVQIRGEAPSHIIAPAIHVTEEEIETDFRRRHTGLDPARRLDAPAALVAEARAVLREKFRNADVGITGANFLIAETGSAVVVTNEGNGDLTALLPRVHIVLASIEKVVPTLEDAATLLRVLARSATGQDLTAYTTLLTGACRTGDPDGPREAHIVLLDSGRAAILGTDFRTALRCIRCGACMNHCPVYNAIGGHAYGWVYPGPIGAVLTPALLGLPVSAHLPNASTFCGACEEVCPVKIPLTGLMRRWREAEASAGAQSAGLRLSLATWAFVAKRPRLYHALARLAAYALRLAAGSAGRLRSFPLARGWTRHRDLPAPEGRTLQQLWAESKRGVPR